MKEVLLFEISLAEASAPREERRNASKLYNPRTLGEYQALPVRYMNTKCFLQAKGKYSYGYRTGSSGHVLHMQLSILPELVDLLQMY